MVKKVILISILLSTIIVAETKTVSLEQVIKSSLEHNIGIQMGRNSFEIQKQRSTIGEAGLLPELSADFSMSSKTGDSDMTFPSGNPIVGRDAKSESTSYGFTLTETLTNLFLPFHSYSRLKAKLTLSELELQSKIENTLLLSIVAYYDSLRLKNKIKFTEKNLSNTESYYKKFQEEHKLGVSSLIDLLSAQSEMNKLRSQLEVEKEMLAQSLLTLKELMGESYSTALDVAGSVSVNKEMDLATVLNDANLNSLALKIADKKEDISDIDAQMIIDTVYPTLRLSAAYDSEDSSAESGYFKSSKNTGVSYSVALSWTAFNGGRRFNQLKNIKRARHHMKLVREETKRALEREIRSLFETYQTSIKTLQLAEEALSINQKHLERSRQLHNSGQLILTELQRSENQWLQSQNVHNNTLLLLRIVELRLLQLSGKLGIITDSAS